MNNTTGISGISDAALLQDVAEGDKPIPNGRPAHLEKKSKLQILSEAHERIRSAKRNPIVCAAPILQHCDGDDLNPILFRNTINVIQGKSGAHKSRLAELQLALFLAAGEVKAGFYAEKGCQVCLIDSERNQTEQLPMAIQNVLRIAGYSIEDDPEGFFYTSLLEIDRADRFEAMREYLGSVLAKDKHTVVVLDVLTDCCKDFNNPLYAMPLIDHLNMLINHMDVTFICVIHENPGSEKARGHVGTEVMHKSTTVLQISMEQDGSGEETGLIKVKYLKCRMGKKPKPFYLEFDAGSFKTADGQAVKNIEAQKVRKAAIPDIVEHLEGLFADAPDWSQKDVINALAQHFQTNEKSIRERLATIVQDGPIEEEDEIHTILNSDALPCYIEKYKVGREVRFRAVQLPKTIN